MGQKFVMCCLNVSIWIESIDTITIWISPHFKLMHLPNCGALNNAEYRIKPGIVISWGHNIKFVQSHTQMELIEITYKQKMVFRLDVT